MKVLVACEYSGIVREAFTRLGHDATSCDLLPTEIPGKHIQGDVLEVIKQEQFDLMIAHPPCTDLAVSGAKWFKEKRADGRQQRALEFVQQLLDAPIPMIALENPVSVISTYIRKSDQYVQPWMFGHGETKRTGLWLKGLPLLRPTNIVEGREQRVWLMGPSPDRWKNRSRTYQGIADAMAEQWGNAVGYSQGRLV
jgi:site-specific DNA-cytosine methylase